jgi:hypothetical protein
VEDVRFALLRLAPVRFGVHPSLNRARPCMRG